MNRDTLQFVAAFFVFDERDGRWEATEVADRADSERSHRIVSLNSGEYMHDALY